MNKNNKCSNCNSGYIVLSMSAKYYFCNNCYKYAGGVDKQVDENVIDFENIPLFSGMTGEEVEKLLNGLLDQSNN